MTFLQVRDVDVWLGADTRFLDAPHGRETASCDQTMRGDGVVEAGAP